MSASDAKSRFTCTVQVRYIMVFAERADPVHVVGHQPVAPLGHHRHLFVLPDRGGPQTDEVHADPVGHLAHLAQMFVHLVAGLVDRLQRRARQLQLSAGLEADIGAVLLQPDDVVALEYGRTSRTAAAALPARRARTVRPRRAAASAYRDNSPNFSCSVPMRQSSGVLHPASRYSASCSGRSMGPPPDCGMDIGRSGLAHGFGRQT